ncbi:MAG: hypothetical protein ACOYVF_13145 [Candidatus Zixiibacteriota bacterium]
MRRFYHITARVLFLSPVLIFFFVINCADDNGLGEDFEGITYTDYYGNVAAVDTDDWCGELTPRYLFLNAEDCKILLPCITPGDSVIDSFSVFNEWIYEILTVASSPDINLTVTPDSVVIPARDSVRFELKYNFPDDSTRNGTVTFAQVEPSALTSIYLSAGPEVEDIQCAVSVVPTQFFLLPAYPNPADVGTIITFALPRRSDVKINVYDPNEKHIAVLVEDTLNAGYHQAFWNVRNIAPDIYDCRMTAGDFECRGNIQVAH